MTTLRVHPDSGAGRAVWIPIDQAAPLIGVTEGNLRRTCSEKLERTGMARRAVVDGRRKWVIAAAYHPRLVRQAVEVTDRGTSIVNELLSSTTAEKRDDAANRYKVLVAFREAKGRDSFDFPRFRDRMLREYGWCPGRSQLYQLHGTCPPSTDRAGCIAALVDRRGRPKGDAEACSDAAWEHFAKAYLDPRVWSIAKCWRATAEAARQEDWAWPSLRRVQELVRERIDPSTACMHREGQDAWRRQFQAPMQQNPDAWAAGQCWESDHCVLDFQVRVIRGDGWAPTRPQLTTWMDRRTRRVMGWEISEQGNQATIRRALLNALRDPAVSAPEQVWIDNGKDFMARSIGGVTKQARRRMTTDEQREHEATATGLLNILGIEPHFATAYNHDGKARIERWHGTVHTDFDREFTTYIGNEPGMVDRRNLPEDRKDVMGFPTLAEVRERFAAWVEAYNHRSEHRIDDLRDPDTRERLSPAEFYERCLPTRRVIDADALKLLEPVYSTPLKVSKRGIGFKIGGATTYYGEMHPALEGFVGTERRVFVAHDPEDISQVTVWDESFRLVCVAPMNGLYGGGTVTRADFKAGLAARRDQKKRVKQRIDMVALTAQPAELAARAARDREVAETKARMREHDRTRDPNDLPNLRVVGTKLDGQADAVAKAHRLAAGAEHDSVPANMPSLIDAVAMQYTSPSGGRGAFEHAGPSLTDWTPFDAATPVQAAPEPDFDLPLPHHKEIPTDPYDLPLPPSQDAGPRPDFRLTDSYL